MIGLATSSGQIQPVLVHAGMDSGDFPQVVVRNAGGALHFHAAVSRSKADRSMRSTFQDCVIGPDNTPGVLAVVKNRGSGRFEPDPQRGLALLCATFRLFLCASFGLFGGSEAQPPQSLLLSPEPAGDHSGNGHD
jgi:hypothetical protein